VEASGFRKYEIHLFASVCLSMLTERVWRSWRAGHDVCRGSVLVTIGAELSTQTVSTNVAFTGRL
jgi:hypothetical protein